MKINELTIGQAREIAGLFNAIQNDPDASAFQIGKPYLIRTVTMAITGRIVSVNRHEIVVEDAAWIADTGRFSDAVKSGKFNEVEPFASGPVIVGRSALIDASIIPTLPLSQQ